MRRNRLKYGILDEEGKVVRWVYEQPTSAYEYVVVKVPAPVRKPPVDWANFEPALF